MRVFVCVRARTQGCIEADAHQVKPVIFYIFGGIECVLAPLKWFVRRLCDQPVVRLCISGVNNADVTLQVHKHLDHKKRETCEEKNNLKCFLLHVVI